MRAWTDYPFSELGDVPYVKAPIRAIDVVTYDRNKYCYVIVNGVRSSIKCGYIYTIAGRCGDVPQITEEDLLRLPREI